MNQFHFILLESSTFSTKLIWNVPILWDENSICNNDAVAVKNTLDWHQWVYSYVFKWFLQCRFKTEIFVAFDHRSFPLKHEAIDLQRFLIAYWVNVLETTTLMFKITGYWNGWKEDYPHILDFLASTSDWGQQFISQKGSQMPCVTLIRDLRTVSRLHES